MLLVSLNNTYFYYQAYLILYWIIRGATCFGPSKGSSSENGTQYIKPQVCMQNNFAAFILMHSCIVFYCMMIALRRGRNM